MGVRGISYGSGSCRGGFQTRPGATGRGPGRAGFKPALRPASMPNDTRPRRPSLRLPGYDYSQAGAYFITACTHNLFGEVGAGFKPAPTEMGMIGQQTCRRITGWDPENILASNVCRSRAGLKPAP